MAADDEGDEDDRGDFGKPEGGFPSQRGRQQFPPPRLTRFQSGSQAFVQARRKFLGLPTLEHAGKLLRLAKIMRTLGAFRQMALNRRPFVLPDLAVKEGFELLPDVLAF